MAKTLDRYQPTLFEFPIQNNRTGWHPVWTPTLLVVPWSYDINKYRIQNSQIKKITFFIEKMIQIEVAGHPQNYDPIGPKPKASPDKILFEVSLTHDQLFQYRIETDDAVFYKADGSITDTPEEGDQLEFTNSKGITGRVEYFPDAEYFDLSPIEIPVDNLASGRYIASWLVDFYKRISINNALFCISDVTQSSKLDYPVNHPGEIHDEMVKRTPAVYFNNVDKKQDFTVNLYRPLADVLQDVFDETELFYGINWVKKVPPQLFPYLAYLIGVELPTQSGEQDLDKIRRRMIERGVELQKLKGSELAIRELFLILGFTIEIINLWASVDGKRFIAPNEPDPEPRIHLREEIKSTPVEQTDPLLADYGTSGFGDIKIPLLYHNTDRNVVISAFLVNGEAHAKLVDITNKYISDPNYLTSSQIIKASDGYLKLPQEILDVLNSTGVEAYSRLVVSDIEVLSQQHQGLPIIRFDGIEYDRLRDYLNITFADYKNLDTNKIFIYATYVRDMIEVPEYLKNNLSNRFDVKIVSKTGEIESSLYDYLIDSLFKFKAFHSLLRKVSYDAPLRDFYNVIDFCNNAYLSGQHDSDMNLSRPPACPITECFVDNKCNEKNARGGIRQSDYDNNKTILEGLQEEYDRWHDVTNNWLDVASHKQAEIEAAKLISNINIPIPKNKGDSFGQDRVSYDLIVTSNRAINGLSNYEMIYNGTYLESAHHTGTEPIILTIKPTKYQILSDIVGSPVLVTFVKEVSVGSYYITMQIDVDQQKDVRSKVTDLDRLDSTDYCYKGRVKDTMLLDTHVGLTTTVRNRPCNLMMGTGVYYELNAGKLDNKIGWYNDLLKKSDQTLHYSDNIFFENAYLGSVLRPSLNIEKNGQGFPGHRPIKAGLMQSYAHPNYKAKPWDYTDNCFEFLNPLNAKIVQETEIDGVINEKLVYDDEILTYSPNFIDPDIDDYSGISSTIMTHSIYSAAEERPYVELDNLVHTLETTINIDDPIFNSAYQCGTTAYTDYVDGYPASTGDIQFNAEDIWSQRIIDGNLVIEADILPGSFTASATYSSEVRVGEESESITLKTYNEYDLWKGYRFDCDCSKVCGPDKNCNLSFFENKNGEYDFNNDHLEVNTAVSLKEKVASCGEFFNGDIQEFLNWDFGDETGPHEFRYKDEYNIEYKVSLTGDNNTVDITCESFSPRVWGENEIGYVTNGKVFRKGTLTTIRQIFVFENNEWKLSAEGDKQDVVFRQTNYDCDLSPPEPEKFYHHYEYEIYDRVQMAIPHGPHWTDPADPTDTECVWG